MSKDKKIKIFIGISTALFVFSMLINLDIIEFNKMDEEPVAENEDIIDDIDEEEEMEQEEEEIDIPPIKPLEEDKQEIREEVKEIDGEKVLIKSTPKPKDKNIPEAMEEPKTEPKPKEPPKLENEDEEKPKDKQNVKQNNKTTKKSSKKPPTYKKEEKPKQVEGGTGSDGVLRDLNGNPISVEGDPNAKPNIIDGSELGEPGDPEMGEGDKF